MKACKRHEALPLRPSFQASYLTHGPKAARGCINLIIFLLSIITASGQVYEDYAKSCAKCSKWKIVRPFADTVKSGNFNILTTNDRRFSYPGNDACAYSITNTGHSDLFIKVSNAFTGNGDFAIKPGEAVRFGDIFNPKDNSDHCYASELPSMQILVSIISKSVGRIKISALAYPGAACPPDTFVMKAWDSTILP